MFIPQVNIKIGTYSFDFVNELVVESSWQQQTSTAVIKIPAALKIDKNKVNETFKKGLPVEIQFGYKPNMNIVFKGYVVRVKPTVPIEIHCEDEMWNLKQIQINETVKDEKLADFLKRVLNVEVDAFETTIPKMICSKISGSQLLDEIKSMYGFSSFFRNGVLVVGKPYAQSGYSRHQFIIENASNCNVHSHSLEFVSKEDVKIKVTAISNMADGTKHEVEFGDPDGETRTLNFYNVPKTELESIAKAEFEKMQYDGYRGSFTAFGEPFVIHGDVVELINEQESDKTGSYWIDGVTYNFSISGVRQTIKPGPRT